MPDLTGSSSSLEPLDKQDKESKVIGKKDENMNGEGSKENIVLPKKYVFNVPYIFSKVELKRHKSVIISLTLKALDILIRVKKRKE